MIIDKIRGSKLYQEKLVHTPLVAFLKRGKKALWNLKNQVKTLLGLQERFESLLPILENYMDLSKRQSIQGEVSETAKNETVDVIVPIYNGYEYLVRLFEDLPKAGMDCRFLLVDDASSDERVRSLEKGFVQQHKNARLLVNETNQGFVGSVNRGLKEAKGHVALVNTDTELPRDWLARLMEPILSDERVASTTPYTNSATIFSFPNFCYNNPIYRGLSVDVMDGYFKLVKPRYLEAPTGVGFCMGMSQKALDEIGLFDQESFDRGYCEENDWCQRALKAGYKNVVVENLFVYHKHGGSFLGEEKRKLIDDHMRILRRKHPGYEAQVSEFIRKDENKSLRQILEMMIDTHETKSVFYFNHSLGGGATSYMEQQIEGLVKQGACVTSLYFNPQIQRYMLTFENQRGKLRFELSTMDELVKLGEYFHYDEFIVNELVLFPYLFEMQDTIVKMHEKQKGSKLIMLCHDLFSICPSINLVSESMQYCGMPGKEECDRCFLEKRFVKDFHCQNREAWNLHWSHFLQKCTEVRTFSEDTLHRMKAVYGEGLAYTLVPHKVQYVFPIEKGTKTTKTLNIGLLGMLTVHKGGVLVGQMLDSIEKNALNIRIILIGQTEKLSLSHHGAFSMTGAYKPEELPELIYEQDIDVFFLSSVWPETFSYTAEEIMKMGMPIVSLDIGAPAKRIAGYDRGLVLKPAEGQNPVGIPAATIVERIQNFAQELGVLNQSVEESQVIYIAEDYSFTTRYRLQHLQEELLHQGVKGQLHLAARLPGKVDWTRVAAVVVYRCKKTSKLVAFLEEAKKHQVSVLCDMDDYIFDFDKIKDLPFLQEQREEYKDFESYCQALRQTMELADRFLVSTNHMKLAVEQSFPGKAVFVNRNAASSKMLVLSAKAKQKKIPMATDKKFVLGYFSGSHTHNRDFLLIAPVVAEFMSRHREVQFQLVGCLELPKEFEAFSERIIRYDFMDWQQLPECMAKVDVNLMPLEDSFFHRCKSENKWLEAGLVGVPTVGSYNPELADATSQGENVLLCKDAKEWENALERLYEDRELGRRLGENAFDYILKHKTTLVKNPDLKAFVLGDKTSVLTVITEKKTDFLNAQTLKRVELLQGRTSLARAKGEYVVFLQGTETLEDNALECLVKELETSEVDMLYTDEQEFRKPAWSPELALELPYVGPFTAYRTSLAKKISATMDEVEDFDLWSYDFMLRFSEQEDVRIERLENTLYSTNRTFGLSREVDVIKRDAINRRKLSAHLEEVPKLSVSRVVYEAPEGKTLSVIIPSKDNPEMLRECVASVRECSSRLSVELIVVDNGSIDENRESVEKLAEEYHFTYHYAPQEFHFSKMCNRGAELATGDVLLFLNDDVVLQGEEALERMLGQAVLPHTGAVGAKLLYPNAEGSAENRIQHDGIVLLGENPSHALSGLSDDMIYYWGRNRLTYNYLAVTAACLMIEKEKFMEAGGFPEELPVAYNDVALCMELREHGYYQAVRNDVAFLHRESVSRGMDAADETKTKRLLSERNMLYALRPAFRGGKDPFYNKGLSTEHTDFRLEENPLPEEAHRQAGCIQVYESLESAFQGYIDSVDREQAVIKGWYFYKSAFWMKHTKLYVVVEEKPGIAVFYETSSLERKDVARKLGLPCTRLGFACRLPKEKLESKPEYRLGLLLRNSITGREKLMWSDVGWETENPENIEE